MEDIVCCWDGTSAPELRRPRSRPSRHSIPQYSATSTSYINIFHSSVENSCWSSFSTEKLSDSVQQTYRIKRVVDSLSKRAKLHAKGFQFSCMDSLEVKCRSWETALRGRRTEVEVVALAVEFGAALGMLSHLIGGDGNQGLSLLQMGVVVSGAQVLRSVLANSNTGTSYTEDMEISSGGGSDDNNGGGGEGIYKPLRGNDDDHRSGALALVADIAIFLGTLLLTWGILSEAPLGGRTGFSSALSVLLAEIIVLTCFIFIGPAGLNPRPLVISDCTFPPAWALLARLVKWLFTPEFSEEDLDRIQENIWHEEVASLELVASLECEL